MSLKQLILILLVSTASLVGIVYVFFFVWRNYPDTLGLERVPTQAELDSIAAIPPPDSLKIALEKIDSMTNAQQAFRDSVDQVLQFHTDSLSAVLAEYNLVRDSAQDLRGELTEEQKKTAKARDSLVLAKFTVFAAMYDNASPTEVAQILQNLDDRDVALILQLMKKKNAALVLEAMEPDRAASVMTLSVLEF